MELKDVVAISGKSGLYRIVKPTRIGFVLEALDESKQKLVTHPRQKVSVLDEISIYTEDGDGSIPLKEVLEKINSEYKDQIGVSSTSSPQDMRDFLKNVVPNFDEERVYVSDIKKLISWYTLLLEHGSDIFDPPKKEKKESASKASKASKKAPEKSTKKSGD